MSDHFGLLEPQNLSLLAERLKASGFEKVWAAFGEVSTYDERDREVHEAGIYLLFPKQDFELSRPGIEGTATWTAALLEKQLSCEVKVWMARDLDGGVRELWSCYDLIEISSSGEVIPV